MVAKTHQGREQNDSPDTPEILECQVCGFPVDRERGLLACDVVMARMAQRGDAREAEWLPIHSGCCGESTFYTIELADLSTAERWLWWTGHLMMKSWVAATDWLWVIRRAGGHA